MHEVGIAASVLDAVRAEVAKVPGAHATRVGLRVGDLCGGDPDSLRFGFDALVNGSDLEPLRLEIETVARVQKCLQCEAEFTVDRYTLECPGCGSLRSLCIAGDELDLAFIELEEP